MEHADGALRAASMHPGRPSFSVEFDHPPERRRDLPGRGAEAKAVIPVGGRAAFIMAFPLGIYFSLNIRINLT